MNNSKVILVDKDDNPTGFIDKMLAHREGLLHRAFSVFIFNSKGEWLIQQRAEEKYHSAGLWTNTCCSHPEPGEETIEAAKRRLMEEMGLNCDIEKITEITYHVNFGNGLTEHEFDHVFIGTSDTMPNANANEVKSWKYLPAAILKNELNRHPENFTYWFRILFDQVNDQLNNIAEWKK